MILAPPKKYLMYGMCVQSDLPLTRFSSQREGCREIRFEVRLAPDPVLEGISPQCLRRRFWGTDGTPSWSLYDLEDRYVLDWANVFTFHISRDGSWARCYCREGATTEQVEAYFVGLVLPFLLQLRGKVGLHASAVALPEGVVGFLGNSGRGKSTMAMAFALAGYSLFSDDFLLVREEQPGFSVTAGLPHLRLSQESLAALPLLRLLLRGHF